MTESGNWLATKVDQLAQQAADLTELRIVTAVGNVTLETGPDAGGSSRETIIGNAKAIESRIGLVTGDIATLMDSAFVTGDYQSVRSFHETQVGKGQQIVSDNIAAVRSLVGLLNDLWAQSQAPAADGAASAVVSDPG